MAVSCSRRALLVPLAAALLLACTAGRVGGGSDGAAPEADGGPPACTGCVDPETGGCVRGTSDVACGAGGADCVGCADTEACDPDTRTCVMRTGCGPGTCPGCCMGDVCVAFDRDEACGADGEACVACGAGATCVDGVCTEASSCGPMSCDGCCDGSGACVPGDATAACGDGGGLCEACDTGWSCDEGTCRPPCEDWCGGCCDAGGVCRDGSSDAACGDGGAACMDCGGDAECIDGTCVELSCSETCGGCCSGDACLDGDLSGACGVGGVACVDCGPGFTCSFFGDCEVDPASRWDLYAVRASFSVFSPSGSLWDSGSSGRPDAYTSGEASAADGTTYTGQTARVDDTTTPVWDELVLEDVPARDLRRGTTLRVRDYDFLSRDDDIGWCYWIPSHDAFRSGRVTLICPPRSDPATVETELTVRLERH